MAEPAFAQTNDYLKTRVQFGQVIGSLPGAAAPHGQDVHRARAARSAVEGALEAIDADAATSARR